MVAEELQLEVPKPQSALPDVLLEEEVAVAQPSCHHRPASPVPFARLVAALPEEP